VSSGGPPTAAPGGDYTTEEELEALRRQIATDVYAAKRCRTIPKAAGSEVIMLGAS